MKKAIENLMLSNPSVPMYTVDDLLKNGLEEAIPSIGLYTYQGEDIIKFRNAIPKLKPMKGAMKLHEVQYILEQQEVTIMIKDRSTGATAQKVSLELDGFNSGEKDDDSDYSETFEEEATEECILLYSVRYVAEGHCKRLRALFDLLILPIKTWFD